MSLMAGQSFAQEICNNNLDDDGDGLIDCRDTQDCPNKVCEIPNDEIDNDGDYFIDCYDKETLTDPTDPCNGFFLGHDALCEVRPDSFPPFEMKLKFKSLPNQSNHINRIIAGDVDGDGRPELVTAYAAKTGNSKDGVSSITASKVNIFEAPTAGTTLDLKRSIDVNMGGLEAVAYEDIAMADINGDGCVEMFVVTKNLSTSTNFKIIAYDCNSNAIWAAPISFANDDQNASQGGCQGACGDPGVIGLADFDGDGFVELYTRTQIFDAHTGAFMGNNNIDNSTTGIHNGVNKGWGMNSNAPIAVDILASTPGLELVAGCRIYGVAINRGAMTATLTLVNEYPQYATRSNRGHSNSTSVADFNQDGYLDVLAVGSNGSYDNNTTIFFWDVQNNTVKTYTDLSGTGDYLNGWKNGAGRINIADIDGDTLMNAVYVSGRYLYALKETPTKLDTLWRRRVTEETSGITGCTMFDFNADGKSEIVYRDEDYIYIYTTENTGVEPNPIRVTRSTPVRCSSRTSNEYPIVVDMDGDGSTEICVTCSTTNTTNGKDLGIWDQAEVRVYESSNEPWVPARKVWNQHGYFVANVNDDLTIPRKQQLHHLVYAKNAQCRKYGSSRPLNSFLNQSPFLNSFGCPSYPAPNLTMIPFSGTQALDFTPPICPDSNFNVIFKFANMGDLAISGQLPVTMYNGDPEKTHPDSLAQKIGTVTLNLVNMMPGDTITQTLSVAGPGSAFTLYIVINDDGTTIPLNLAAQTQKIIECDYDNILFNEINPQPAPLITEVEANFKCDPGAQNTGIARAYVDRGGVRDSTNFKFYWFDGPLPIGALNTASDSSGHVYPQLDAGTYSVIAIHKVAKCASVAAEAVIITDIPGPINVKIDELNPYDNCKNPNGVLKAVVYMLEVNGDTTELPTGHYTYLWRSPTLDTLGIGHTVTGLGQGLGYSVTVTEKATGCSVTQFDDITDQTTKPVPDTTHVDIICSNLNSGAVSATVDGDVSGYKFYWYNGSFTKPAPDFTGPNYTNRPAGFYTLVVEDNNTKCESDSVIVEVRQTPAFIVSVDSKTNQTSCDVAQPNGNAVASVNGTTTGYRFVWYRGQSTNKPDSIGGTASIASLAAGVYTVKAIDNSSGCTATDTVNIFSRVVVPSLTASGSPMLKCEPLDGAVTAIPNTGNINDYTFTWYNGAFPKPATDYPDTVDNVLSGLKPGIYSVKAFNNVTHCEAIADSALVRNLTPTINITVIPNPAKYPTDCNTNDGEISATISSSGNTNGFTVDWFTGIRPNLGNPAIKSQVFTTNPVSDLVTGVMSGQYTIKVINEDDNCQAFKEYFLPSKTTDSVSISGVDLTQCTPINGEIEATLIVNRNNPAISTKNDFVMQLFKIPGASSIGSIAGTVNPDTVFTFANLDSGRYYVRGIPAGGSNVCPVATDVFEIKWNPVYPTLALDSVATTSCEGTLPTGQVIALAVGPPAFNYEFFTGLNNTNIPSRVQNGASNTLSGQLSAFYTVKATAGNGCFNIKSIFVPADTAILAVDLAATPLTMCSTPDGSITINSITETDQSGSTVNPFNPAQYSITWPVADPVPGTPGVLENLDSGTYIFEIANITTGCKTGTITSRVDDERIYPTINLIDYTVPTMCQKPTNVQGQLVVQATGNDITGFTYSWFEGNDVGDPPLPPANVAGTDGEIAQNILNGVYTIRAINNTTDCPRIDTFSLPLDTAVIAVQPSALPLTFCSVPNGELFATVSTADPAGYSYNWYYITTLTPPPFDFSNRYVSGLTDSTYVVLAVDLADARCFVRDTIRVEDERVYPVVTPVLLSPNTICDNSIPDGIVAASVNGDVVNYTFDWYGDDSPNPLPQPSFASGSQISGLLDSTYNVIATHIITGCPDTASVTVNFAPRPLPPPTIEVLSHVTSCIENNGALAASVNGVTFGYTFVWYDGSFPTTPELPADSNFVGEIYDSLATNFYTVKAIDNYTKCVTDPAVEQIISQPIIPEFEIAVVPSSCEGNDGEIYLTITNDIELASITWERIDAPGAPIIDDPVLQGIPAGEYRVTVVTQLGCRDSTNIIVKTDIRPFNGVSRNGDGKNDYFHINCIEAFEHNLVRIYNRAGTLVYEREDYRNDELDLRFDGRANKGITVMGNNLPDGTYFFIIDKRDGSKPVAGYLEIVN